MADGPVVPIILQIPEGSRTLINPCEARGVEKAKRGAMACFENTIPTRKLHRWLFSSHASVFALIDLISVPLLVKWWGGYA